MNELTVNCHKGVKHRSTAFILVLFILLSLAGCSADVSNNITPKLDTAPIETQTLPSSSTPEISDTTDVPAAPQGANGVKITIDRFEGTFAVAELPDGQIINVPRELFPNAAEGDIYQILKDSTETDERKGRIQDKFNKLIER